jgi:hypothetical protein
MAELRDRRDPQPYREQRPRPLARPDAAVARGALGVVVVQSRLAALVNASPVVLTLDEVGGEQ